MKSSLHSDRRSFIKGATALGAAMAIAPNAYARQEISISPASIYQVGPLEGYSPHIGTMLSMMTMMRTWVVRSVEGLSVKDLDHQLDDQSNSIGAMLYHLAATEKYYQLNTFDDMEWGSWSEEVKKEWDIPMKLGPEARDLIKGKPVDFYLEKLQQVRSVTMNEFAKRDDDWIFQEEKFFQDQPTNNYCKWFHVCEHESNHNGQIKYIKKRLAS
jgi:hypothetical protein